MTATDSADHGAGSGGNGPGLASIVLGGVSLLLAPLPGLNDISPLGHVGAYVMLAGIVLGVVGLALGVVGLVRRHRRRLTAIIGVALSVLSLATSAIVFGVHLSAADDSAIPAAAVPVVFEPGSTRPAEAGVGLSPDNPAPFGSTVRLVADDADTSHPDGWEVTVGAPNLDAADVAVRYPAADLSGPYFEHSELAPGEQYAYVPVGLANLGSTPETPGAWLEFAYTGPDGRVIEAPHITAVERSIFTVMQLDPEASADADVIIPIPSEGAAQGVWSVRYSLLSPVVYFGEPASD